MGDRVVGNERARHAGCVRSLPCKRDRRRREGRWPGILAAALLCLASCSGRLPTDAQVRAQFTSHRAEFDSLAALATADTQLAVVLNFWGPADIYLHDTPEYDRRLPDEELRASWRSAYRRLVERTGVRRVSRSREGRVVFTVVANPRAGRGLIYSPEPMTPLRPSLDDVGQDARYPYGYVQVAPNWYLWIAYGD